MSDVLDDIKERSEYATNEWQDIRSEGAIDMAYVNGDPWDADDKQIRAGRVTIAPDELAQYRNQVVNALRANPRGMKFSPRGGGASAKAARFYENKAREIEYRSHAANAYILAIQNALERGYGFVRVLTKYASERDANQEIWIEAFPDPEMVTPDPDAKRTDSSDMQYCFVDSWQNLKEWKKTKYGKASRVATAGNMGALSTWVKGDKIRFSEYWAIETRKRTLLLIQPPQPPPQLQGRVPPQQLQQMTQPVQLFADEWEKLKEHGGTVVRELREVDYPSVRMYLTNGLEILHEQDWPGKHIPIVSFYGLVRYVPEGGESKRNIVSMTKPGRAPWKGYCYTASQQLEVIAQVPKTRTVVYEGQLAGHEEEWRKSAYSPTPWLYIKAKTAATGEQILPPPTRMEGPPAEYLQGLEIVKEGQRRQVQAAMGSSFLPTQAQRRNEKSGVALDKIDQAASQGTYHFVQSYDDGIQRVGEIVEDLVDKIHDYEGEVGTLDAKGNALPVQINNSQNPDAIDTKGQYLVTVSSGPSSDSEEAAVAEFTDTLVSNMQMIIAAGGPPAGKKVLGFAIRKRNMGPEGEELADMIDPPPPQSADGKPLPPEMMALKHENEQMKQVLQQAAQEKQAKVVEQDGKFKIAQMQESAETDRADKDRAAGIIKAEISAKFETMTHSIELMAKNLEVLGERLHDSRQSMLDRAHEEIQSQRARQHEQQQAEQAHGRALELADQAVSGQMAVQDNAPSTNGDGA